VLRVQLEPAYLLSVRPYRETSMLLEGLTAAHGRVGLVARGARGEKSKLRGVLQPFRRVLLSWSERGELGTLAAAEVEPGPAPCGEAVMAGWYLNELLLRLLQRRDPHPGLFEDYEQALHALGSPDAEAALRIFEKRLLAAMGYGLHLPESLEPGAWYDYDEEQGPRMGVAESAPAYRGASLLALAEERLDSAEALRDARRLLRAALSRHLGDRALETPRLFRALRKVVAADA